TVALKCVGQNACASRYPLVVDHEQRFLNVDPPAIAAQDRFHCGSIEPELQIPDASHVLRGTPDRLVLGYPVEEADIMPAVGCGDIGVQSGSADTAVLS